MKALGSDATSTGVARVAAMLGSAAHVASAGLLALIVLVVLILTTSAVYAQQGGPGHGGGGGRGDGPSHGSGPGAGHGGGGNYPPRGYEVRALPRDVVVASGRANGRYYYSHGAWYAPRGPRYVVVAPPIGAYIPFLPGAYSTFYFGGIPYYYANDTYYRWRDHDRVYEVVDPPAEAAETSTAGAPPADQLFVYPKDNQSEETQAKDRYECHRWAAAETTFDPTQTGGGVASDQTSSKRADYLRAQTACLEGRGYSVK